jgi:hypothetical protein
MQKSNLGYPFSYGDELTPKMAKQNQIKIVVVLLLFCVLKVERVEPAPLPGAEGFTICPKSPSYSREATGLSTKLVQNPNIPRQNRAIYNRRLKEGFILDDSQILMKFKHAKDFQVYGKANRKNFELFKDAIERHMRDPGTRIINGTFRNEPVIHFFNEGNSLNAMFDPETMTFVSLWELKDKQYKNVNERGAL